ncbi:Endoplasmic reticulum metallopeptidase 1 [Vitis vinifera]|uniref:Endoplasmic reticulum metallopeptidase 1 n=1 Tax=Vitis vinifera TaxID=29760 RepID=A0A438CMS2_VITVI|nr:Endoplasmic reticulum metallopeptidase 1 [Vitis vinifera]
MQDVFPVIPGDTDYRIFAEDYGDIPGLDIIFLLGGYFYHTSYDTMERLLPGSIQARGENLLSITRAFANSSKLLNAHERESLKVAANEPKDERAVFFDYLSWFMIFYSRRAAVVLHTIPIAIFLLMPFLLFVLNIGKRTWFSTFYDFFKGLLLHTIGVVLAVVVPIVFAILRLLFSNHAMSWFARPYLAFMMFIPCSLVGVLIPRVVWRSVPLTHGVSRLQASKEFGVRVPLHMYGACALFLWGEFEIQLLLVTHFKMIYAPHFASCIAPIVHLQRNLITLAFCIVSAILLLLEPIAPASGQPKGELMIWHIPQGLSDDPRFWGVFGFYALLTLAYLVAGLSGGFLTFSLSVSMLAAWISFHFAVKLFDCQSLRSAMCYVLPLIPCITYSVYFGGFLAQFLIEKMGMMGSIPPPYGYFIPDIIVAAVIGLVTSWCVGPLIPICGHWLARSSILKFLLQLSVLALALSSQFFPYSIAAPKRVVFHIHS